MTDLVRAPRSSLAPARGGDGGVREFLSFGLAGEAYAVELTGVREIVNPPPLTGVPRAPDDILGICSVRGLLVTVVDLRRRLRLEERPATKLSRILLTYTDTEEVLGLFVDEVRQVVRLSQSQIEVTANVLGGNLSDHVLGIGRPGDDLIILLDLSSVVGA